MILRSAANLYISPMKVFISHTQQGADLARKFAKGLRKEGLHAWLAEIEVLPGDNWAEKVSNALNESQAMIALLTPDALEAGWVLQEVGFALGRQSYRDRVIPVLVGSANQIPLEAIPQSLRRFKTIRVVDDAIEDAITKISHALLVPA